MFITFGTLAAGSERNHGLFRVALEAVGGLPVRALFSTGAAMDLTALGAVPENVTVTSWVRQGDVFPRAAVLVCHGGAGTVLAGLTHGLPMVVTPISADQPDSLTLLNSSVPHYLHCGKACVSSGSTLELETEIIRGPFIHSSESFLSVESLFHDQRAGPLV